MHRRIQLKVSVLILACRSISKGEAAKANLLKNATPTSRPQEKKHETAIHVWQIDMSSYASVQAFAKQLEGLPRLDALIANAGISTTEFQLAEKVESTLTVNVISTILLACLALPKLKSTASITEERAHLSFTGSVVQCFADPAPLLPQNGGIFRTLTEQGPSTMSGRYFLSKLILQLAFQELAERSTDKGVIINIVNPGWCKTELFRQDDGGVFARNLLRLIGWSPEEGARTLVSAIANGRETHGKYLSECKIKRASSFARSLEGIPTQRRVWANIVDVLEVARPGIMEGLVC